MVYKDPRLLGLMEVGGLWRWRYNGVNGRGVVEIRGCKTNS